MRIFEKLKFWRHKFPNDLPIELVGKEILLIAEAPKGQKTAISYDRSTW